MNPTVLAAAIGLGGTVIVGVAGFGAAIWNTRKAVRAARNSRVWDERAKIYVDVLAAVQHRAVRRAYDTPTQPVHPEFRRRLRAYLDTYAEPDWHQLEARQLAFADKRVVEAVQASSKAHRLAIAFHDGSP
jgi:hypothetical protein